MLLKKKAPLIVVLVALLTSAACGWSSYSGNLQLLESCKKADLETAAAVIQSSLIEQTNKAAARAALVASLPNVQKNLRAEDQKQMIEDMTRAMEIQRDQFGVREAQFHLAPALSFLRVLGKTTYKEDLSGFREMVVSTNQRHEPEKGVEIGRRGLSIRGVFPVIDAQGQVGSFEIGMDFEAVLREVKKITGADAGVFVEDRLMTDIATSIPRPDQEHIVGIYRNVDATNWQAVRPLVNADALAKATEMSIGARQVNGIDYGVVIVPLLDFKGKHIGAIVAVKNFENYQHQVTAALTSAVACTALQAILLAGAVLIVFNGMLMRPVDRIGRAVAQLADGDKKIDLADLPKRKDEIGVLARNLQKIAEEKKA